MCFSLPFPKSLQTCFLFTRVYLNFTLIYHLLCVLAVGSCFSTLQGWIFFYIPICLDLVYWNKNCNLMLWLIYLCPNLWDFKFLTLDTKVDFYWKWIYSPVTFHFNFYPHLNLSCPLFTLIYLLPSSIPWTYTQHIEWYSFWLIQDS